MILVDNYGVHNFYVGENLGTAISHLSIKNILGDQLYMPKFSFIADLMCFDKDIVEKLITSTESKFRQSLHHIAIECEQNYSARFSKYELYGIYTSFHPDNNIVKNFLPKSEMMDHRKNIVEDQSLFDALFVP